VRPDDHGKSFAVCLGDDLVFKFVDSFAGRQGNEMDSMQLKRELSATEVS
jgi:hypothetical protein